MTEREIQMDILRVCKVAGHDGDFNVVGFYALCDRLKQLGAEEEREEFAVHAVDIARRAVAEEREACAKLAENYMKETDSMQARGCLASVAYDIRARGK